MSVDLCHVKLTWTDPLGKKKCSNKHEYCNYISVSCYFIPCNGIMRMEKKKKLNLSM